MKASTDLGLFALVRTHESETGLTDTAVLAAAHEQVPLVAMIQQRVEQDEYGFIHGDSNVSLHEAVDGTETHILSYFGSVRYEILPVERFVVTGCITKQGGE